MRFAVLLVVFVALVLVFLAVLLVVLLSFLLMWYHHNILLCLVAFKSFSSQIKFALKGGYILIE